MTNEPQAPYPPPKLLKGALVSIDRSNSLKESIVAFQYNPNKLTRSLTPQYYKSKGDRFTGPAKESIDVTVQLEAGAVGGTALTGVLAPLAALEMMVNPSSSDLETYINDVNSNKMKAVPPLAPRTLFIWGPSRVLPVQLTSISVTEELFNSDLSPMLADVALKMDVYPFDQAATADYQLLLTHLKTLETFRDELTLSGASIGLDVTSLL